MDNLRHTIEVLFRYQELENVRKFLVSVKDAGKGVVCDVDKKWFQKVFCHYFNRYPDDEVKGIYGILDSKWLSPKEKTSNTDKDDKSIFNVLFHFTSEVLHEQGSLPVCKFDQLLRWQEMTTHLGEDLFTTSFFAYRDAYRGISNRNDFAWPWHIPSDNVLIGELWKRGLVDIHYHLNNSYAIYDLNWLSLMNKINKRGKQFEEVEKSLTGRMVMDNEAHHSESLQTLCIRAAALRLYLFCEITDSNESHTKDCRIFIHHLKDSVAIQLFQEELQYKIESIRHEYGLKYDGFVVDYAIPKTAYSQELISDANAATSLFFGERQLLYRAFKKVYSNSNESTRRFAAYLYEYLLIKARFREEMIQINQHVGFDNFKQYQDRKDIFLRGTKYEKLVPYLSVHSSTASDNVKYIEARVGLGNTAGEFVKNIQGNDKTIEKKYFLSIDDEFDDILSKEEKVIEYPQHYIVQLHKKNQYEAEGAFENGNGRNAKLKKEIKKTVIAYNELRKSMAPEKYRVCGIDAVASETGCRPECFGQAYRYLRQYSHPEKNSIVENDSFPKVGFTYHVGEDFLDIVDGLRAIDEAILFLELQQGDRIGHGLALGVDAKKYYETRHHIIVLPKQDMLDNIVWMYIKSQEYGIAMPPNLELFLKRKYFELVSDVYPDSLEKIGNPFVYYQSMLLRSDAPDLYQIKTKEVSVASSFMHFWDKCGLLQNGKVMEARKNKVARLLYYNYQFEEKVKKAGRQSVEVKFPVEYQMVVAELQKQMMRDIAARGISIETNPSSNYNIAQLKRYDNHPITKFFNLGLMYDNATISECPQISVSINTDDQGLFSTSLENEYAIMAAALIKQKNPDDTPKYTERLVYDWLERIRMMGWEQRFESGRPNKLGSRGIKIE